MSNTPRNKNLLIIIAVLLLTNIAVLGYFLFFKTPGKPFNNNDRERNGITEVLQKEVGFSDEQVAKYKELKEKQQQTIRPMFDDMRKAKDSLFSMLSKENIADSVLDKMSDVIAQKQKALDLQTFRHFKNVRGLCTVDQQPKYDSMLVRMFKKMGKPQRKDSTDKK